MFALACFLNCLACQNLATERRFRLSAYSNETERKPISKVCTASVVIHLPALQRPVAVYGTNSNVRMLAAIRVSSPARGRLGTGICPWPQITLWCRQVSSGARKSGQEHNKVTVIGGGAAGLTSAYFAAYQLSKRLASEGSTQQVHRMPLLAQLGNFPL
jgi:hypothetical protein